jgi:hypothetical protein
MGAASALLSACFGHSLALHDVRPTLDRKSLLDPTHIVRVYHRREYLFITRSCQEVEGLSLLGEDLRMMPY